MIIDRHQDMTIPAKKLNKEQPKKLAAKTQRRQANPLISSVQTDSPPWNGQVQVAEPSAHAVLTFKVFLASWRLGDQVSASPWLVSATPAQERYV